ncbi:hypothetical protein PIB30_098828, partial [Stylosanthes scabra]|nr:hypothetical protein [Stylosanthes scabra]
MGFQIFFGESKCIKASSEQNVRRASLIYKYSSNLGITEITSGWVMLLVVCLTSFEEKTTARGGFPSRVLGITSTARHECRLLFAAFLEGGFPSSGIPPEIIAISRFRQVFESLRRVVKFFMKLSARSEKLSMLLGGRELNHVRAYFFRVM